MKPICLIKVILILNLAVLLPGAGYSKPTNSWSKRCLKIKKQLLSNKTSSLVFSPKAAIKPSTKQVNQFWVLKWNGINIPIPAIRYINVHVSVNASGRTELIFISKGRKVVLSLLTIKNKKIKDVYATSSIKNNKIIHTNSGVKATSRLFGTSVRLSTLAMMGYNYAPNSLGCKDKYRVREIGITMALVLKTVGRAGELISVHKDLGRYKGWLEVEKNRDYYNYKTNLIDKDPNWLHQINYRLGTKSHYAWLPYIIGNANRPSVTTTPKWLQLLNTALASKKIVDWKQYIKHAKTLSIDVKLHSKLTH